MEKAEAEDRIPLKGLRAAANALDCDLVYALVPRANTIRELTEGRAREQAQKRVPRVEHSMALENTWGGAEVVQAGDFRRSYIDALRAADTNDIRPLLTFART